MDKIEEIKKRHSSWAKELNMMGGSKPVSSEYVAALLEDISTLFTALAEKDARDDLTELYHEYDALKSAHNTLIESFRQGCRNIRAMVENLEKEVEG